VHREQRIENKEGQREQKDGQTSSSSSPQGGTGDIACGILEAIRNGNSGTLTS
jgi:hypothetical protein